MSENAKSERWHWLSFPLAIGALAWTVWLLWDSIPLVLESLPKLHWRWLGFTLVGNVVAGYLVFEAFRALFEKIQPCTYPRFHLAHLYFTGQLMKHLPGRIWGIAYQAAMGNRASMVEWVSVTSVFMVLSTGFAVWVATTVLSFMFGFLWGVLALITGAAVYLLVWKERPLKYVLFILSKLPFLKRLTIALEPFIGVDTKFKATVGFWYIGSWFFCLLAWAGYGIAWPELGAVNGILLAGLYTIAWFIGYISLVTPSGLGVRELSFVILAQGFPPDAVAGMLVFGRLILLLVDIFLGFSFLNTKLFIKKNR